MPRAKKVSLGDLGSEVKEEPKEEPKAEPAEKAPKFTKVVEIHTTTEFWNAHLKPVIHRQFGTLENKYEIKE